MNTKKSHYFSGFSTASSPMTKYSDFAWSEAGCNNNKLADNSFSAFLTAGELNLMSRFSSLNSSSIVIQPTASDSDATSSTTSSSNSATANNSSGSISVSPTHEREARHRSLVDREIDTKSIHNASNHLLELQKEIKEEEEEIFADINSLINSRSNLYSTFDDGDDDTVDHNDPEQIDDNQHTPINFTYSTADSNLATNITAPLRKLYHKQSFINDEDDDDDVHLLGHHNDDNLNDYQSQAKSTSVTIAETEDNNSHDYQSRNDRCAADTDIDDDQLQHQHPKNQHVETHHDNHYATDEPIDFTNHHDSSYYLHGNHLHDENPNAHEQNTDHEHELQYIMDKQEEFFPLHHNTPAVQAAIQQVTSNLPKPCVFFLEGNCRRSDCKYSHDLSNITCKYWIEGFCFKGELCPFLHSYNQPSDSSSFDDDGIQSLPKKEIDPTFVIESEADFPSLPLDAPTPTPNDSSKNSMNADAIKSQILSSNTAVVFKTVKKKRKRS